MLLRKLRLHGIDTRWFSEYLVGHTQSVSLRDSTGHVRVSPSLPNTMGVFQGSALGPLLFTVFANDLSLFAADACVVQYADDTQVIVSGKKANCHLSSLEWKSRWSLWTFGSARTPLR